MSVAGVCQRISSFISRKGMYRDCFHSGETHRRTRIEGAEDNGLAPSSHPPSILHTPTPGRRLSGRDANRRTREANHQNYPTKAAPELSDPVAVPNPRGLGSVDGGTREPT